MPSSTRTSWPSACWPLPKVRGGHARLLQSGTLLTRNRLVFLHGRLSEDDREQVSRATQAFLSAAYLTLATITYPSELISLAAIAHALAALAATKGTAARPALAAAFAPYEGILQEIIAYARQESTVL